MKSRGRGISYNTLHCRDPYSLLYYSSKQLHSAVIMFNALNVRMARTTIHRAELKLMCKEWVCPRECAGVSRISVKAVQLNFPEDSLPIKTDFKFPFHLCTCTFKYICTTIKILTYQPTLPRYVYFNALSSKVKAAV